MRQTTLQWKITTIVLHGVDKASDGVPRTVQSGFCFTSVPSRCLGECPVMDIVPSSRYTQSSTRQQATNHPSRHPRHGFRKGIPRVRKWHATSLKTRWLFIPATTYLRDRPNPTRSRHCTLRHLPIFVQRLQPDRTAPARPDLGHPAAPIRKPLSQNVLIDTPFASPARFRRWWRRRRLGRLRGVRLRTPSPPLRYKGRVHGVAEVARRPEGEEPEGAGEGAWDEDRKGLDGQGRAQVGRRGGGGGLHGLLAGDLDDDRVYLKHAGGGVKDYISDDLTTRKTDRFFLSFSPPPPQKKRKKK